MSLTYRAVKRKILSGPDRGKEKYFVVVKHSATCDLNQVATRVSMHTHVHPVDIKRVIRVLKEVVHQYLEMGHTVHLDELGSFGLTVSSEGVDSPFDLTKKNIKEVKIHFRPGKGLCPEKDRIEFKKSNEDFYDKFPWSE